MKNILFIVFTLFASLQLMAQEPTEFEDKIYRFVQIKAEPEGGIENFQKNLIKQLDVSSVPQGIEKILLRLRFVVEKDGSFGQLKVLLYDVKNDSVNQMTNDKLSKEAIRVLNIMPKWKPAQHEGHIVRSSYTTSIVIEINKDEKQQTDDKIYSEVDEKAEPEGGMEKFRSVFLYKLKKPYEMPSDIVTITMQFVVEKDGSFTNFRVLDNKYRIGEEAILLLKKMPKWKPAQHKGKVVRSAFSFSFAIAVDRTQKESTESEDKVYSYVSVKAEPEGGMEKFRKDFSDKLELNRSKMPPDADRMLLFHVRFTVEKDGSLTDIEALDNEYEIGDKIVKVLKTMPKWKPATHNGKIVRSNIELAFRVYTTEVLVFYADDLIYRFVQQKAEPQEGMEKFRRDFVCKFNMSDDIPVNVKQVTIKMRFVVEKDGSLTDIKVLDTRYGMGNEAIRVLKTMSKWKPAKHHGKVVRSDFRWFIRLPVNNTKEAPGH